MINDTPFQPRIEHHGIKIMVTSDYPKMQLSKDCPVTPAFRVEMNSWMLDFFGTVNDIEDGITWLLGDIFYMNPRTWEAYNKTVKNPIGNKVTLWQ